MAPCEAVHYRRWMLREQENIGWGMPSAESHSSWAKSPTRWCALLGIVALCFFGFSNAAIESTTDIRLIPPSSSDLVLPWTLGVSGMWPNACAPEIERINIDGNDVRIDVRNKKTLCDPTPAPFAFNAAPAAASGVTLMPAGSYHVSIYAAQGVHAPLRLYAFGLVDTTSADAVATPESGYWWAQPEGNSKVSPGTGLVIELQGRTLTVSALSYESNGEPVWYLGTGLLESSIAHIPMLRVQGGSVLFGEKTEAPHAAVALHLDLEFQSSGRAVAWFTRSSADDSNALELRALTLSRMAFADPPDGHVWQGDWILVPDDPLKATQRLHFDQLQTQSEQNFRLSDSNSDNSLNCWRDTQRPSAPPQSCTLQGNNGITLAQFNAVAIGRLEGVMPDHGRIRLIRLTP